MNSDNMELKDKILNAFSGKVVRKDLAFRVKGNLPVPAYVLEYLLGQYCACDDEAVIAEGIEKVKNIVSNNYVNRSQAEEIKAKIKQRGRYTVIDKISVQLNDKADQYEASFANLGINHIPVNESVVSSNDKLLSGNGVWSIVVINYLTGDDVRLRWEIQSLKPIQIANLNINDYIDQREKFTTDEWIDLLIHTVGLNPDILNRREKFVILARLLPHIENNYNFMELGPKGTGKSHVYQEFSPYSVLVSGGDVTSARLFVKMSGNRELLGLVGYWDVVAWDEYEQKPHRVIEAKLVDIMQNYLANKNFNRGKGTYEAIASMAFVGNTKHTVPYMLKNSHLFESIPSDFLQTGAFLDRIHLYNPGWEAQVLKKNSFSTGYGLITDYMAAVLHELRNRDYSSEINKFAKFDGSLSERDHLAIRKTFSGMMKLIYPNDVFTDEEAYEIINFAAEGRKRVKDQLYKIDETFKAEPAIFEYENLKKNVVVKVETLENLCNPELITDFAVDSRQDSNQPVSESTVNNVENKEKEPQLSSKYVEIRENQMGVSYKSLFGDYMRSAKKMTIIDPYIRATFQVDNLVDLVRTFVESTKETEGLEVELHTYETDEKLPALIDNLDQLQDDLARYGVEFTYSFDADHDRSISLDNGWRFILSRGIDIFEKFDRFSLSNQRQELRRCRAFSVTYLEE